VDYQALSGLPGINSIYDDIVVHRKSEKEYNRNLEQLLCRLQEKDIDKCQFNMERIEFMGHILSEHGIGVSESKVQAGTFNGVMYVFMLLVQSSIIV
jgi:hypothetical protein